MRITFANDTEPGRALLFCTEEAFPDVPLRLSLQRARDHRFLGSDGHWFTQPVYLEVDQRREGADLVLVLGPEIVSRLADMAHRVGLMAPDGTLFKGQVTIRGVRYVEPPPPWSPDWEAERLRLEAEVKAAREEATRLRREAEEKAAREAEEAESLVVVAPPSRVNNAPTSAPEQVFTNSVGMEFVLIPAGKFWMGSADDDEDALDAFDDEKPRHEVTISQPFYLGRHEVTQAQWQAVMGNNPSRFQGPDRPVENVSWEDAQAFIAKLNAREGHTRYRLPTEAEWEYACRAGSTSRYCFGDDADRLGDYAWHRDNSGGETHPVGQKRANAWGLYDMHGNVWEWCSDWYGRKYYSSGAAVDMPGSVWEWCSEWYGGKYYNSGALVDPQGPEAGERRVLRGGDWDYPAWNCRSANRGRNSPGMRDDFNGFRLALSPGH